MRAPCPRSRSAEPRGEHRPGKDDRARRAGSRRLRRADDRQGASRGPVQRPLHCGGDRRPAAWRSRVRSLRRNTATSERRDPDPHDARSGLAASSSVNTESRWSPVAEKVFCPAAVACGERRVALFMRGAEGELLHRERDGDDWSEVRSLGVPVARIDGAKALVPADWPISACSTGADEIHLLARGSEGELLHGVLRGSDWEGFDCFGAPAALSYYDVAVPMGLASAPAACSRAPACMDVFAVGAAGALLHCTWDGAAFSEFESLGGAVSPGAVEREVPIAGSISACNCGGKAMGVFTRGAL